METKSDIAQLTRAFEVFSAETKRLESAYAALKNQFKLVNYQLEESNRCLEEKVQELDRTTQYLDSIVKNLRQGLLFIGKNGRISTVNPAAEQILDQPVSAIQDQIFWDLFPDTLFGFSLSEALEGSSSPERISVRIGTKDVEVTSSFSAQQSQHTTGLIVLLRDVTELCRLRTLAARNDRLKELGEMAASVAHEIRNPLGGIRGFADLLVRDLASAPELQAMARQIADGAETINRLITHTLNYARPVQLYKTDLDLADLLESVAQVLRLSLPADQQQRIHVECSLPHAPLNCDGLMLKNALCNLTLNGLEASEPDRPVALRLHRDHDRGYRIDIVDEGCGIPEENIEKIFSPFFTTKHCGNGFGLSEALKTVEAHGGTIEVDSQVGHGSTVSLFLP